MRYEYLTFDCYGTLVDWRNGILSAFAAATAADVPEPEPERLLALHARHEAEVQAGPYRLYRQVLTETARRMAADLGLEQAYDSFDFLADSLPLWRVFPEVEAALAELGRRGVSLGILSNIDDDLLAATLDQLEVRFDLLITAEQVRSYKPAVAHFETAREHIGGRRWLHVAQSQFHDIAPAQRMGIAAAWINRLDEAPAAGLEPVASFADLSGLSSWLA
ncbi:MAG: haloacid dehalogenase type II [Thermoanaerobaculia bacterium]